MHSLSLDELKELAAHQSSPSISILMPTHRRGRETQQDPIRFGNQLRLIEAQLIEAGWRSPDVAALLARAHALREDSSFWPHQQDGLAVFMDAEEFLIFRLPFAVEERTVVADRYFLAPLLPLFTANGHYYILALSENAVRLFEGTRFTVGEIDLPSEVPTSAADVTGAVDSERGLQARTVGAPGTGFGVFYGTGGTAGEDRKQAEKFLNELDKALLPILRKSNAPLVIAGDVSLLPIYRSVTNYAHVVAEGPRGNPEMLRADELHDQAWPFVEPIFRTSLEEALGQYAALVGTGRTAAGLDEIIPAARFGRVDTLLLPIGLEVWGTVDDETARVTRTEAGAPGALELEGFAAAQVLLNGGTVYAVEAEAMPAHAEVAAILRF